MSGEVTFLFYIVIELLSLAFIYQIPRKTIREYVARQRLKIKTKTKSRWSISLLSITISMSLLVLFFLLALRDQVGADYVTYTNYYIRMRSNNAYYVSNELEWSLNGVLFWFICKIFSSLGFSHYIMFAIIGFITLFFFYKSIIVLSEDWLFSLFLLFSFCIFYHAFNEIRQMTAVAIAMYSIRYLIENDKKKFITIVLLGACFHITCLIFLITWFTKDIKINYRTILAYILLGLLFFIFFNNFLSLFSNTYYGRMYIGYGHYAEEFSKSTVLNLSVRITMFVFCLLFSQKTIKRVPQTKVFYHIVAICTILQLGAVRFMLFGRLTMYFYVAYIFLIPEVVKTMKQYIVKQNHKFVNFAMIAFFTLMHYVYFFAHGAEGGGYLHYNFMSFF